MVKIPSALKWMLDRRARLMGEIKKVEQRQLRHEPVLIAAIAELERRQRTLKRRLQIVRTLSAHRIADLQVDMAAIDSAISQHHVMVDVENIAPTRSQDNAWHMPHGQMSRLILKALREADGGRLTTTEVAIFVATTARVDVELSGFKPFKLAIRSRLRAMHANGKLQRVVEGNHALESRWAGLPIVNS